MIAVTIAILLALWLLGVVQVPGVAVKNMLLFRFNGHPITLLDVLIFIVLVWAVSEAPGPFRVVGAVILVLWVLATLGVIAIYGLSNLLVLLVVGGLVYYLATKKK